MTRKTAANMFLSIHKSIVLVFVVLILISGSSCSKDKKDLTDSMNEWIYKDYPDTKTLVGHLMSFLDKSVPTDFNRGRISDIILRIWKDRDEVYKKDNIRLYTKNSMVNSASITFTKYSLFYNPAKISLNYLFLANLGQKYTDALQSDGWVPKKFDNWHENLATTLVKDGFIIQIAPPVDGLIINLVITLGHE